MVVCWAPLDQAPRRTDIATRPATTETPPSPPEQKALIRQLETTLKTARAINDPDLITMFESKAEARASHRDARPPALASTQRWPV